MKSGIKKIKSDHRDYDFHKSFGSVLPPSLPPEYNVDAGLSMLDQNAMGLPYGCTGFAQTSLCEDEDGVGYDAGDLYRATPPGGDSGRDIRDSLKTLINRGVVRYGVPEPPGNRRSAYFNVRSSGPIDMFDAIRLALYSTQEEKRAVSVGIPWFSEFETHVKADGIMPIPVFDVSRASWHNACVPGWVSINGVLYLKLKSWQGPNYGHNGWCYMSRELCNVIFSISGSAAFTVSKTMPGQIYTIDLGVVARIVSYIRLLFGLS